MANNSVYTNYNIGKVAYTPLSDSEQVFRNLAPRVFFKVPSGEMAGEFNSKQKQFIKEILVPPFLQLKQKFPCAYKMLMRKSALDFQIIVNECENKIFSQGENEARNKSVAITEDIFPDNIKIEINNYDKFSKSDIKFKVYHELMHAILNVTLKDEKSEATLAQYLDEIFEKRLTNISKEYIDHVVEAHELFYEWQQKGNLDVAKKDAAAAYLAVFDMKKCWATRQLNKDDDEDLEYYINHSASAVYDANETIAWGLTMLLGSDQDRKRLMEQDEELYIILKGIVLPIIKEAAVKGPLTTKQIDELIREIAEKHKKRPKNI